MQSIFVCLVLLGFIGLRTIPQADATSILDFPWMATIEVNGEYICSGAIIDDRYIVSSQNCTGGIDLASTEVFVRTGTSKLGFRGQALRVIDILPDTLLGTDLTLVQVATSFEYGPHTMWVNIDNIGIVEYLDYEMAVWSGTTRQSTLVAANVTVINKDTCKDLFSGTFNINDTVACFLPKLSYKDSCLAQLGTPIYYDELMFGVVSYNPGCDNESLPLVVTMTGGYTSYIISTMCGMQNINKL